MQTLLAKGTYSKYLCKVGISCYRFESYLPGKEKIKKISFLNFFVIFIMLGDIPKRTYKFTTVKDSNSKLFSICAIYTNQEEKNLVSPNTKKEI